MATYVGFYRVSEDWWNENAAKFRSGEIQAGVPTEPMATKVREFPSKMPAGCKLVGSYVPIGQSIGNPGTPILPGVTIVETDDPLHLNWITQYYAGFLSWFWHPYQAVPRT